MTVRGSILLRLWRLGFTDNPLCEVTYEPAMTDTNVLRFQSSRVLLHHPKKPLRINAIADAKLTRQMEAGEMLKALYPLLESAYRIYGLVLFSLEIAPKTRVFFVFPRGFRRLGIHEYTT